MGYTELFQLRKYRNTELGVVGATAHEYAVNTAKEPSAGLTTGLNDHAMKRQRGWVAHIESLIAGVIQQPVPDIHASRLVKYEQDHKAPTMLGVDGEPINQVTLGLSQMWQVLSNELLVSNSAAMGGGMSEADEIRANEQVGTISQFLDSLENAPTPDLPATANPDTVTAPRTTRGSK